MNLINDAWIPIRRESGKQEHIAPWQLPETEDPVIALNAPRPDFNGALMQFLIGLLQTAATPESHDHWLDWLEEPPTTEELKKSFAQYAKAFELQSENGSFLQDFDALEAGGKNEIAELLIDSPGENTIKENKDHFVKRGSVERMCFGCVATALFSLQTNAPSGGAGHRTSLRGGGPLTTLVLLDTNGELPTNLWRNVWLNVLERQQVEALTGERSKSGLADVFPWLAKTRTSEKHAGVETTPIDVNSLQMYWGMPRRIKIQWQPTSAGRCNLCDTDSDQLITHYRAKNYGVDYSGAWQHPLSPYSRNKDGELLPRHAQPGGLSYQHWLGLVEHSENQFSAEVVKRYRSLLANWNVEAGDEHPHEQLLLHVFGYDMDNMKARCWYETTFPLFTIPATIRPNFIGRVETLTQTASDFAGFVRTSIKDAWFKRPGDAKGDTSFLVQSFYQHTEKAFYEAIKTLQTSIPSGTDKQVLQDWHKTLRKAAFDLFDYWAARGDFTQGNPRRVADARSKLNKLVYSKKIKEALQLPGRTKEAA